MSVCKEMGCRRGIVDMKMVFKKCSRIGGTFLSPPVDILTCVRAFCLGEKEYCDFQTITILVLTDVGSFDMYGWVKLHHGRNSEFTCSGDGPEGGG